MIETINKRIKDSSVSLETRLRSGRYRNRGSTSGGTYLVFNVYRTTPGSHPISYSVGYPSQGGNATET